MKDFKESVMIALIPVEAGWCQTELPHMTLVYAGKISDLNPRTFNEMGKTVLDIARKFAPPVLVVDEPDVFGGVEDGYVDVLVLKRTPDIDEMRSLVDIWNVSKHPFNPHVTVGPAGSLDGDIPTRVAFQSIMVAWGDRRLTCRFTPTTI